MLNPGSRIGHFGVVAPIGAGGMGEVYRARDERIGRDVAIKVLPVEFASDPDRLRRFEQEARAAGQLNHPNILALHDVGSHEGAPYLVSELLEGQSLRERLEGGPLPPRKVIEMGVQVCSGLAAAHEKGIVHRDLKPANVFVTKDGHVKILDFGVAKLVHPEVKVDPYAKTTASGPTTEAGTVLGTAAYMSPEQVRGQAVDHRSDVFSLGVVLYEMLSGAKPFHRDSAVETMNAILKEEPPELTTLDPKVPAGLTRVVQHCLEKHPADRFQSARDLAFALQALSTTSGETRAALDVGRGASRSTRRERLAWSVAVVAGAAIGALLALDHLRQPPKAGLVRLSVTAPAGGTVVADPTAAAISPDGRQLVFTVMDARGTMRLWVRPLDSLAAQPLPGTENGIQPFWSPDSRFVGFFADGKLRKVALTGGSPEVISDAPNGRGGSWSGDGVIIFAPHILGPLLRVSEEGGEPVEIAKPDAARGETGLRFPCFLPDGRHFLYVSLPRRREGFDVYAGALDGTEGPRRIMTAGSAPVFAGPGHLLFAAGDRIVAQRFDPQKLQLLGDVTPLGTATPISLSEGGTLLSASANGVLVHPSTTPRDSRLVWLDRSGQTVDTVALPAGSYGSPSLSPDGRRAIVSKSNSPTSFDLWLVDLPRAVASRLTFDGHVNPGIGFGSSAVWSRDGRRAAFECDHSGIYDVCQVLISGGGQPEPLIQSSVIFKTPGAWSPDGKYLVFSQNDEGTQYDLWLLPLQGDRTPVRYLHSPFNETTAAISPDGRWLAYDSDETGASEIYVRSFPEPGEKHRVSTAGGIGAQWSRDGTELVIWAGGQFFSPVGSVYSVDVQTSPTLKTGTPRLLFAPRQDNGGLVATSDLSRFLAVFPAEGASPASITIMLNWQAALER